MGLLEVFYAPGKLFSTLPERKGAWVLPLLLNCLLVTLVSALAIHYVGMENITRQQMEGMRLSPEQLDKAVANSQSAAAIYRTYIITFIFSGLAQAAIAGMLLAFGLMGNKQAKYSTTLSMVAFAMFPYYVVICAMSALILAVSPDPSSLNIRNLIATNLAAFLNKDTVSKGVYSLASSIDILSFAEIFLLSLGFSKINRTSFIAGLAAVGGIWLLYVFVKLGLSALF